MTRSILEVMFFTAMMGFISLATTLAGCMEKPKTVEESIIPGGWSDDYSACRKIALPAVSDTELYYLDCVPNAQAAVDISKAVEGEFDVPLQLVPQILFWHKVYAYFSINDYVLHSGEYPDVMFEMGSAPASPDQLSSKSSQQKVKRVMAARKRYYYNLLHAMQRGRVAPADQAAAERINVAMYQIQDHDKYLRAAQSLRVQRGQKEFIQQGQVMVLPYATHIRSAFTDQGLPGSLAFLAFVESSFNINAVSKVGASGVYQLMPAVGREHLKVTSNIDERRDPIKSAEAAAKILRCNYEMLGGSWPLAITAYNHGAYGVMRAADRVGSRDLGAISAHYRGQAFGFASKNYYTEFLGVLVTLRQNSPGLLDAKPQTALTFVNYRLPKSMQISKLLKTYNLSKEDLMALNPDISRGYVNHDANLPSGYVLKIPQVVNQNT